MRWRGRSGEPTGWMDARWAPSSVDRQDSCLLIRQNVAQWRATTVGVGRLGQGVGQHRGAVGRRARTRGEADERADRAIRVGRDWGPDEGDRCLPLGRRSSVDACLRCLPGSGASMPAVSGRVTPEGRSRAIGAIFALARRTRSAGASSTWRPRRPADTNIDSSSSAAASTTTGSGWRAPSGLMPADDVACRPLRLGRAGHRRSPTVERHRPGASDRARSSTGTTARTSRPSTAAASVLCTRRGSTPSAAAASDP